MSSPAAPSSGVGRASLFLASGTLVSRLLGFVSAYVLAQTLGNSGVGSNTFAVANQLPNNIYAIIAGGLLSAVLVPQIVRAGMHDDGGQKFINRIVTLGAVVFVAVAAIATVCAPFLVNLYARQSVTGEGGYSPSEIALTTAFAYWCLPQILFYALYSLLGEVLNARKVFGPFTWAPVVNNVVAIAGLLIFNLAFGGMNPADAAAGQWTPGMITVIAGSATLGVAAQAFVLFLFWRRAGLKYRPEFQWRGVGLGRVGKAAAWTFGMILVTQLAGLVQSYVATSAGADNPSSAALKFAWLIFMLPHSIVTVSVATAYFTRMSGHAKDGDLRSMKRDISSSLRTIGLIMVFAAVGLIVLAFPFSSLFANNHDFTETDAMAKVLIAFLPGLIPFTVLFVLQRAFYALEDTRTPFFIQVVQSVIFVIGAALVSGLPHDQIAAGIAWVTTIAGTVQALTTALILRRRIGGFGGRLIVRQFSVFLLATVPAAAVGVALISALGGFAEHGFAVGSTFGALFSMALVGIVMALVYFVVLVMLRPPELRALILPLTSRLRRR
ncbi:murein biosynthesis integral membrane protein MurJ [Glaciihabitans sp. dw_435]|uniref:murein biosynthesis integral membrane protein MurJ n=1 Tax=Glaciihabitans sp. dw_435 TaxID=2720081 RepID=UPI001BD491E1|nr:murein biosynthesis integral membrane protein MurJ [Glaciihabitans sp. dw_435]